MPPVRAFTFIFFFFYRAEDSAFSLFSSFARPFAWKFANSRSFSFGPGKNRVACGVRTFDLDLKRHEAYGRLPWYAIEPPGTLHTWYCTTYCQWRCKIYATCASLRLIVGRSLEHRPVAASMPENQLLADPTRLRLVRKPRPCLNYSHEHRLGWFSDVPSRIIRTIVRLHMVCVFFFVFVTLASSLTHKKCYPHRVSGQTLVVVDWSEP